VGGDFGEGGRGAVGDDLEAEGVGLPSFEGVAEDGDLAGEGLDREEEEEEKAHWKGRMNNCRRDDWLDWGWVNVERRILNFKCLS